LVIFGLDLTVRVLESLGFNIKNTAKTAEQVLAITSLFVGGLIVALLFFLLVKSTDRRRVRRYGLAVGGAIGLFSLVLTLVEGAPAGTGGKIVTVIWVLGLFLLWGLGLARLLLVAFPAPWTAEAPAPVAIPGDEEEINTLPPAAAPPYAILTAASSLSACTKAPPASGSFLDIYSGISF
jgi:hypothetical protein